MINQFEKGTDVDRKTINTSDFSVNELPLGTEDIDNHYNEDEELSNPNDFIDTEYVEKNLGELIKSQDLSKFIP